MNAIAAGHIGCGRSVINAGTLPRTLYSHAVAATTLAAGFTRSLNSIPIRSVKIRDIEVEAAIFRLSPIAMLRPDLLVDRRSLERKSGIHINSCKRQPGASARNAHAVAGFPPRRAHA